MKRIFISTMTVGALFLAACGGPQGNNNSGDAFSTDVASKVYVKPGTYDEFYAFMSGGFS